jgi:hypothetical protein
MRPRHATASALLPTGQAGSSAFASTLSGRGSEPSTPVAGAARKQTPFAATPPTSSAGEEAAPATSPSLERLMSGAQRMSPAVIHEAKAHAATQLEVSSQRSDSAMLHGAPARVSPKKRTQMTQQQQQKQPKPGKSLDERLGRMPAGQPKHNMRKATVGRATTAGETALQRPPRRIKPSELSPAAVSPPPVQHATNRQWPLPGAHAVSTAWPPEPSSSSVASASKMVLPLAFGTMPPSAVRANSDIANGAGPSAAQRSAHSAQPSRISMNGGDTASGSGNDGPSTSSGVAPAAVLEPSDRLQRAGRLGTLFGHPLRRCAGMALAPELDLLLQLLLLPAGLEVAVDQARNALLNSTEAAVAFAATAIMQAGDQSGIARSQQH